MKTRCIKSFCAILGYHLIKREILLKLKIASRFKTKQQNVSQWDKKEKKIHSPADLLKQAKHMYSETAAHFALMRRTGLDSRL